MKRKLFTVFFTLALLLVSVSFADDQRGNTWIQSFSDAKEILHHQIYLNHRITFYCGCPYDSQKNILPCKNYEPKSDSSRSKRVEWEHVVPASHFGQSFPEWRKGHPDCVNGHGKPFKGRNCAEKTNFEYRLMQCDLYNLYPSIGEINNLRRNYRFDMVAGERREFGPCDFEIDNKTAEPPERIRGDIARTYKYMDWAYPDHGIISRSNRKLFDAWDKMDPVDDWECERCRRIEEIQGNENPFVKKACP